MCSYGPAKLRYFLFLLLFFVFWVFLFFFFVFSETGFLRYFLIQHRWLHGLWSKTSTQMEKQFKTVKATMSLSMGHKYSVIPRGLLPTQGQESDGALEAQLTALGLTQHRAKCPSPKSLLSDTE